MSRCLCLSAPLKSGRVAVTGRPVTNVTLPVRQCPFKVWETDGDWEDCDRVTLPVRQCPFKVIKFGRLTVNGRTVTNVTLPVRQCPFMSGIRSGGQWEGL